MTIKNIYYKLKHFWCVHFSRQFTRNNKIHISILRLLKIQKKTLLKHTNFLKELASTPTTNHETPTGCQLPAPNSSSNSSFDLNFSPFHHPDERDVHCIQDPLGLTFLLLTNLTLFDVIRMAGSKNPSDPHEGSSEERMVEGAVLHLQLDPQLPKEATEGSLETTSMDVPGLFSGCHVYTSNTCLYEHSRILSGFLPMDFMTLTLMQLSQCPHPSVCNMFTVWCLDSDCGLGVGFYRFLNNVWRLYDTDFMFQRSLAP